MKGQADFSRVASLAALGGRDVGLAEVHHAIGQHKADATT